MRKLQFTPQVWIIIAVLAYVIPTAIGYLLFLRPLFAEANRTRENNQSTEEYVILKNTATQLGQFRERIADRNRTFAMRSSLDSIAVRADVKIMDVKADTSIEQLDAGFYLKKYTLIVEGNYVPLSLFVLGLEQTNNYYSISHLTIERIDNNTGKVRAQFIIHVLTAPGLKNRFSE